MSFLKCIPYLVCKIITINKLECLTFDHFYHILKIGVIPLKDKIVSLDKRKINFFPQWLLKRNFHVKKKCAYLCYLRFHTRIARKAFHNCIYYVVTPTQMYKI